MMKSVVVGSRGSQLALKQTQLIIDRFISQSQHSHPNPKFILKKIRTEGDQKHQVPLAQFGGRGVFVKELETALLAGEIDLAVHSLKDLPSQISQGLVLAAVGEREDPRDALVSRWRCSLTQLPAGARLGTGSPRRAAQLKHFRPDFQICGLRGNLDTRLRKSQSEDLDGVIVAAAGILRLGWQDQITEYIPSEICLPAVGQGALVVETRSGDREMLELASIINHEDTRRSVAAERAFLGRLGGGCQVPIACLGTVKDSLLELEGMVSSVDGTRLVRSRISGRAMEPEGLGQRLAERLLEMGAEELLSEEAL